MTYFPLVMNTLPGTVIPLDGLYLEAQMPDGRVQRFPLRHRTIIVGRSPQASHIVLDEPQVSRLHLQINRADDGTLQLYDLGTMHGTQLDGVPVTPHTPYVWEPGQVVRVGETTLTARALMPKRDGTFAVSTHASARLNG